MEPHISIITLGVADMARSIAFFRNGLGFPTNITGDTAKWAIFRTAFTPAGDPAQVPKDFSVLAHSLQLKFSHERFHTSLGDSTVRGGNGQATSQRHSAR